MVAKKQGRVPQTAALKQMLGRCSSLGWEAGPLVDVPRGHFVAYVGTDRSRFVVPIPFLERPEFQRLLRAAEELFGFEHRTGLTIPCDVVAFRSLTAALGC